MTLATPLALLALVVLAPLAILHLRRPSPRRITVASLLDWRGLEVGHLAERRRRFRRIPPWLLVLQALALASLALGLARFGTSPSHHPVAVVVVDDSLAMQTRLPSGGTRLALARRLAAARVTALAKGTRLVLVAASSPPRVIADTADHTRAVAALAALQASSGPASLAPAAQLGLARAGRSAGAVTVFRAPEHPAPAGLAGGVVVGPFVVDRRIALTARCPDAGGACTLLARVTSDAPTSAVRTVTVTVDGRQADRQFVRLRAQGETDLVASLPPSSHVVSVTVAPQDALAADDTARVVLPDSRRVRVVLVAAANRLSALRAAFAALPYVRVTQTAPTNLALAARSADLLVVDRHAGLTGLPTGPSVVLVDPRPGPGLPAGGKAQAPSIAGIDDASPLLADVDLTSLHVSLLRRSRWPAWLAPLVTTPAGPLLLAGTQGASHLAVVAFDPAGLESLAARGIPVARAQPRVLRIRVDPERAARRGRRAAAVGDDRRHGGARRLRGGARRRTRPARARPRDRDGARRERQPDRHAGRDRRLPGGRAGIRLPRDRAALRCRPPALVVALDRRRGPRGARDRVDRRHAAPPT